MKTIFCMWVKTPNGEQVECEIMEQAYSPKTFFEMGWVRALHGTPFNGQNCAVVPMVGNIFMMQKEINV